MPHDISGFLWKKGGSGSGASPLRLGRRNWTRRFTVIEGQTLTYYKLPDGATELPEGHPPRGTVDLSGATAMDAAIDGKEHCFAVHKGDGTMVWFRAESAADKVRWLDYLDASSGGPARRGANPKDAALRLSMESLQFENTALARELEVARKSSVSLGPVESAKQSWDTKDDDEDSLSSADGAPESKGNTFRESFSVRTAGTTTPPPAEAKTPEPVAAPPPPTPAPPTPTSVASTPPPARRTPSPAVLDGPRVSIASQEDFAF